MDHKEGTPSASASGIARPIEDRLEAAVIETNEAVQRLADIVAQAMSIKEANNVSNP